MPQTYGKLTWWQWVIVIGWTGAVAPSGFSTMLGGFVMAYALVLFVALAHRNYVAGHAEEKTA